MTTCWACEAALDSAWKYCTQCGVPIERDTAIPSAIRPDGPVAPADLSLLVVFAWIMAGIGAALAITALVLVVVVGR